MLPLHIQNVQVVVAADGEGSQCLPSCQQAPAVGYLPSLCSTTAGAEAEGEPAAAHLASDSLQVQLLSPPPGAYLEADTPQLFAVAAPAGGRVAVGSPETGWVELQQTQHVDHLLAPGSDAEVITVAAAAKEAAGDWAVFTGRVVLPRVCVCYIAVRACGEVDWLPTLGLHVWPPVSWDVLYRERLCDTLPVC